MQVTREVCRKRDVENSNLRKVSLRQLFHVTRLFADRSRILYWIFSRLLARGDISEDHRYLSSLFTMLLCFCCVLWVSFFNVLFCERIVSQIAILFFSFYVLESIMVFSFLRIYTMID